MANCPKCQSKLKKSETMVFCSEMKNEKQEDGTFKNVGTCDFRIMFKNKIFGDITADEIKKLLANETIKNKKGDSMTLDIESRYFTKIQFAKKEIEDF